MKHITLSNNQIAIVDDEDYERVSRWRWKGHSGGYAARTGYAKDKFVTILMHRLIVNAPEGVEVHHRNGNKLDNQKHNLELVEPLEHRLVHIQPLINSSKQRQLYPDEKLCAWCGYEFTVNPRKRKRSKCCSPSCAQSMRIDGALKARGLR